MIRLRESFAAKILAGFLGTVGLLSVVTFVVVQGETERQVRAVSERAVQSAETQFQGLEAFQRREVDRVARLLAEGRRTLAELDEAIEASDRMYLAGHVAYELDLADIVDMVVAFTDSRGRPVLTLHNDVPMEDSDPLRIGNVAADLLAGDAFEVRSYRVLEGHLFGIRTRVIELAGRPIGSISFGLPVTDADIARIGEVVGVEVCLVVSGNCVAGTPRGRHEPTTSTKMSSRVSSSATVPEVPSRTSSLGVSMGSNRSKRATASLPLSRSDRAPGTTSFSGIPSS